jgi:hypothetical protein
MPMEEVATISVTRKRTRRNAIHPRSNDADMLREFSLQHQLRSFSITQPVQPPSNCTANIPDDSSSCSSILPPPPQLMATPLPIDSRETDNTLTRELYEDMLNNSITDKDTAYHSLSISTTSFSCDKKFRTESSGTETEDDEQDTFTPPSKAPVKRRRTEEKEDELHLMAQEAILNTAASQLA